MSKNRTHLWNKLLTGLKLTLFYSFFLPIYLVTEAIVSLCKFLWNNRESLYIITAISMAASVCLAFRNRVLAKLVKGYQQPHPLYHYLPVVASYASFAIQVSANSAHKDFYELYNMIFTHSAYKNFAHLTRRLPVAVQRFLLNFVFSSDINVYLNTKNTAALQPQDLVFLSDVASHDITKNEISRPKKIIDFLQKLTIVQLEEAKKSYLEHDNVSELLPILIAIRSSSEFSSLSEADALYYDSLLKFATVDRLAHWGPLLLRTVSDFLILKNVNQTSIVDELQLTLSTKNLSLPLLKACDFQTLSFLSPTDRSRVWSPAERLAVKKQILGASSTFWEILMARSDYLTVALLMKNLIHPESVSVVVTSTICKQEITLKRSDNTLVNLFLASYSDNYLINPLTIITFSSSEVTLHLQRKLNIAGLFLIAFLEKDKESDDYRTFVALLLGTYTIGVSHNKYDAKTQRGINHLIKASPISFASNTIKIVKEFTCTRNNFRHSTYSLDIANPLLLTDRIKDFLSQNMNVLKTIENFTDLPGFDEAFADTDLGSVEAAIFWREIAKVIILAPTANNHSTDYPLMFDKVEHLLKLMKRPIATNTRCLENLQETLKVMLGELAVVDHTNQKKREEAILVEAIQACEAYSENQDSLGTLETLKTTLKKTQILAHPDKRQVVFSDPLIINYREQMEFFKDNFSSSNTTGAPSI